MNNLLWAEIMKNGKKNQSNKQINVLNRDDINSILATCDFFGAENSDMAQIQFDLSIAKYRVFDWLAMGLQGRISNSVCLKVLIHAFTTADFNEKKFIENLQCNDYQCDTAWESIEV